MKNWCGLEIEYLRKMAPVFDGEENIVGKGENAGYQHFLLFQQYFQKPSVYDSFFSDCCEKSSKGYLTVLE